MLAIVTLILNYIDNLNELTYCACNLIKHGGTFLLVFAPEITDSHDIEIADREFFTGNCAPSVGKYEYGTITFYAILPTTGTRHVRLFRVDGGRSAIVSVIST